MQEESTDQKDSETKQPDEVGTVRIDSHIKIFDPNTDEVFVDKRS